MDFDYVLLTTDQSFLHITNILRKLDSLDAEYGGSGDRAGVWSARFNHFQPIGDADCSSDLRFPALSFPPLPASSSFLLSRRLVAFLAANADQLEGYSSLAASLAIWLSAVSPRLDEDRRWRDVAELASVTELQTGSDVLAVDSLSAREIEEIWRVV